MRRIFKAFKKIVTSRKYRGEWILINERKTPFTVSLWPDLAEAFSHIGLKPSDYPKPRIKDGLYPAYRGQNVKLFPYLDSDTEVAIYEIKL